MSETTPDLPPHIEQTVQTTARLHAEHYERSTPLQRIVDALTARAGRPRFVVGIVVIVVSWIGLNLALGALGRRPLDPPPFSWLQGAITLSALCMTCLILTTQRREDQLSSGREQLTLELSILAEQKAAKIIQLLEELRRDSPTIANRYDQEAADLSAPSDPRAVLDAIRETHDVLTPDSVSPAEGLSTEANDIGV